MFVQAAGNGTEGTEGPDGRCDFCKLCVIYARLALFCHFSKMGFKTWAQHQALKAGRSIRGDANAVAAGIKQGAGLAWMNSPQLLDAVISSGALASGALAIGAGGPLGTVAGIGMVTSGVTGLTNAISHVEGGPRDPNYTKSAKAKKRSRAQMENRAMTAPGVGTEGDNNQPKISGDMRSRMANMAAMR